MFSVAQMFVTQHHVNIDRLEGYRHVPEQPFLALFGPRVKDSTPCPNDPKRTILFFTDGSAAAIHKQPGSPQWQAAVITISPAGDPEVPGEGDPEWVSFGDQPSARRWLETVDRIIREYPRASAAPMP